jgi:phosphohistidine phosphatase
VSRPLRRLVLIRHATAAPGSPDIDRSLTPRGRAEARAVGEWLLANGLVPDIAVVSPAVRTRETWAEASSAFGLDVPSRVDRALYADAPAAVLEVATTADPVIGTIAVVAHNPTMHTVALRLAGSARHEALIDYPPATVSVFTWSGEWDEIDTAELVAAATCRG